jgi:hypothetical protein
MAIRQLYFLFAALTAFVAAENSDAVWGWQTLTPAKGYEETTFKVQNGTKVMAYIDDTYDPTIIKRAVIQ